MFFNKQGFLKNLDLFIVFFLRNFNVRYRQSLIGIGWAIFQPSSLTFVFMFIFKGIMSLHVSKYPAPLFFYCGLLIWTFFSASLNRTIPCIVQHQNLITKVPFSKIVIPLSTVAVVVLDLLISLLILVFLMFCYKVSWTILSFWFLGLLLLLIAFTVAIALFLSALNVFYRDVQIASNFLIQLWFFVTPVFYSVDKVSLKFKAILFLNPLTFIVENSRRCLFEGRGVIPEQFLFMLIFILLILYFSYKFFKHVERKFADVI